MIKKVIAGVLSAVLCSTALLSEAPRSNSSTDATNPAQTAEQQSARNGLEGKNSLARYISQAEPANAPAAQPLKASAANSVFAVTNLEFDPETGQVRVVSSQSGNSTLTVSFTDEDNSANVYRLQAKVQAGEYVLTDFAADLSALPEYYTVSAQLENEIGMPVSKPFTLYTHTRSMQEILETDISDFDSEQVVNFDADEKTNFIVLSEDTVQAESDENRNVLVSADYEQNIYVFDHIDETIRTLEKGQYFYIQPTEEDVISTDVQDIVIDGDIATITGTGEIDDMFDFIKIEINGEQEYEYPVEVSRESDMQFLGANASSEGKLSGEINLDRMDDPDYTDSTTKFSYQHTFKSSDKRLSINLKLSLGFRDQLNVYKNFGEKLEVHFLLETIASASVIGKMEDGKQKMSADLLKSLRDESLEELKEKKEGFDPEIRIPTPIPGIDIVGSLTIALKPSLVGEAKISYSFVRGFQVHGREHQPIEADGGLTERSFNVKAEAALKIEVKLGVSVLGVLEAGVKFGLTFTLSAEFKLSSKKNTLTGLDSENIYSFEVPEETKPTTHACNACIKGKLKIDISVELYCDIGINPFKKSFSLKLLDIPILSEDWHSSITYSDFGFGPCPYIAYRATLNISCWDLFDDVEYALPAERSITVDGEEHAIDENGQTILYCKSGRTHNYSIKFNGKEVKTGNFTLKNEEKEISIKIYLEKKPGDEEAIDYTKTSGKGTQEDTVVAAYTTAPAVTLPPNTTRGTVPQVVYEYIDQNSVQLGDAIWGHYYPSGYIWIHGHGDMYENNTKEHSVGSFKSDMLENVQKVIIENTGDDGSGIENICQNLFKNAANLEVVYLPDTIKRIGNNAFYGCEKLKYLRYGGENDTSTTFVLPPNLTFIGMNAFYRCKSAAFGELMIPETVESVGNSAFYECEGIKSVNLKGTGETVLGQGAFSYCINMEKAVVGDGVASIGKRFIHECISLQSLTIPYCGKSAADKQGRFYDFVGSGSAHKDKMYDIHTDSGPTGKTICYAPTSLKEIIVTGGTIVPNYFFSSMKELMLIGVPDSITSIGRNAFSNCLKLQYVKVPPNVTTIGVEAYENCQSAKFGDLIIPDSVTSVGYSAFRGCLGLRTLYIQGNGETELGTFSFFNCTNLKKAVIGSGVSSIGKSVFASCWNLESLTIPYCGLSINDKSGKFYNYFHGIAKRPDEDKIYYIHSDSGATGTTYWYIPNVLTEITVTGGTTVPYNFFRSMKKLESITLPAQTETVEKGAFFKCEALSEANLIGEDADWDAVEIVENENQPLLDLVRKGKPLMILLDPMDKKVCMGDRVDFVVAAAGKYDLQYQWQISTDGGSTWTDADSQEPHLIFTAELEQSGNLYRCIVTDAKGNKAETAIAELIVTEEREFDPEEIEENPEEETGEDLPESEADDKEPDPDEKPEGYLPGDTDGSGAIDVSDAVLLARYCVEDRKAKISDLGMLNADVNGNGYPDSDDQTLIVLYIAKRIDEFPVGKP